ncbi:DUF721 domain-containing protein [Legionella waltersii]|uniref:DUF721 domain-containing protein n=1 Tax=Legionella waltersii TaxID=66969 RepID=A0A0W1AD25_9GAMM|nr:DUF721 domain-containing protein [Legionella waltersii]KTD79192.1 hypothetical protein Lwal_1264 [Legionella waltersii]SNV12453.1 Zn-ribbon-containing, possible RNA-binding protein-like protein [Legionella waltersii]
MQSINKCLNKQLSDICMKALVLEELSQKIVQFLPEQLSKHCSVGSFNKGCLLLTTNDAAWATQLHYYLPELRDKLRKEAGLYQLASIKIKILETTSGPSLRRKEKSSPQLSEENKATIIRESQQCTYEPLQRALMHLAQSKK